MTRSIIKCPECGDPLSSSIELVGNTGEIKVRFFCEGAGDDVFDCYYWTGISEKDLRRLKNSKERIEKKGVLGLAKRKKDTTPK